MFREHAAPSDESGASTPPARRAPDAAAGRREPSPDRASDGNESPSAPSEYLAEFLSAIMRRQYAEALKYCRLILQYEPHNATARGFHPLLQQKLRDRRWANAAEGGGSRASSGSEAGSSCSGSERSERDESSLELESESASASGEASRRTDSGSGEAARSEVSRSDADDNGNLPGFVPATTDGDLENDNATGDAHSPSQLKSSGGAAGSLRRLRAQFACSIK